MGRRTRELIALAEAPPGSAALGREQATALLRAVGADAVPQVVERLADARVKWPWAKLLAELRVSTEAVTGMLARVAADRRADGADRAWAARALSRLGRTDLLLALADRSTPSTPAPACTRRSSTPSAPGGACARPDRRRRTPPWRG
ncbi:hypothetical protein ACFY7B_11970 [Streptomyces albidoflavus]